MKPVRIKLLFAPIRSSRGKLLLPLLLICVLLLLTSCGDAQESEDENVLIYAALNPVTRETEASIKFFNKNHPDTPIEVHDYSDEGGPQRLLTELVLGKVPDIMEMQQLGYYPIKVGGNKVVRIETLWIGSPFYMDISELYWMPYRQMAEKGYLEDLWPYIENDPSFGRGKVVEAPLKAAEIDGGLYMLFSDVSVYTLAGARSVVGDRLGWTLADLVEAFSAMPEGSTVLEYGTTRSKVFYKLLSPMLDQFIDWETGECSFDNDEFRGMLGFLELFPDSFDTVLTADQLLEERTWRQLEGMQMLDPVKIDWLCTFMLSNERFREAASYVGYPTADGSLGSSFILQGQKLAMSSTCKNKEAAWAFIRQLLVPKFMSVAGALSADEACKVKMPVHRIAFRLTMMADMDEGHRAYASSFPGGPIFRSPDPTEEDRQRFEELVNSTTQIYWPDTSLADAVWDTIAPYFSGDRTLEETIDLVQRRVQLYVNELR